MTEPIVDRDPGDENDYGRRTILSGYGLCVICKEDAALPDDDICAGCLAELQIEIEKDVA